jgi:methanogenic corrinoid protein MtbC1
VSKYRIRVVAELTGMSPALLRAWEARYGLVSPARSDSKYRLYSDDDVATFLGAQRLVQQGLAPMEVAKLPRSKLLAAGRAARPLPSTHAESFSEGSYDELVRRLMVAIAHFDGIAAEELLTQPLLLLKPEVACRRILAPLMHEIGERWHARELSVAAEHFGTALVRSKLIVLLETMRARANLGRVLCACPPGEAHEVGLLLFAVEAAVQGFAPIYLGANLPLDELAAAVREAAPDLVAASLIVRRETAELKSLLVEMKAAVGKHRPLLLGGGALTGFDELVVEAGCVLMPVSERLIDLLPSRRAPSRVAMPAQ